MNSNTALAALIVAAQEVSDLRTKSATLEKKLLAATIDPLLTNCDLHGVRRLARGHREAILLAIERSPLTKLQAYSKKWNPHRAAAAKDASQQDLIRELSRLATGTMEPVTKPPLATKPSPTPRRTRRRSAAHIAAE